MYNCRISPKHGLDQVVNRLSWDGHPLLQNRLEQLRHICRGSGVTSSTACPQIDVLNAQCQWYVAEILQLHAIPLLAAPGTVFQQDTTRPHAANYTTVLHQQRPNSFLALSPGFNPVWQPNASGRSWMDMFKAEWMLLQKHVSFPGTSGGVDGHPSAGDSQPDPVHV